MKSRAPRLVSGLVARPSAVRPALPQLSRVRSSSSGSPPTLAAECDTVIVGFTDVYGRLLGKRFERAFFEKSVRSAGTHGCNYLLTCGMNMEVQDGFDFASWMGGYGDFHLAPDLDTLCEATWLNHPANNNARTGLVLCDVTDPHSHELVPVAPRSMLKGVVADMERKHGLMCNAASELEYFIYQVCA